jgi:hypothetical protein
MKSDELIRFVHDARIEDFHKGIHQLDFISTASASNLNPSLVISRSPHLFSGSDTWGFTLSGDGLFTTINEGTPKEQRVPLDQSLVNTKITVRNSPKTHLGLHLESNDPIYLSELIIAYFENLVFEASKFCDS